MEAAAGRSVSLAVPSSQPSSRKQWRAISEHSFRNNEGEEPEHLKLGHSDERTIYEDGTGPVDVDLCSITIEGEGLKEDILQRRLQEISRQREELQHVEIELKAQAIARSEIMKVQNSYRSQLKEHVDATAKLKDQLQEREEEIHELEFKLEEKERELHAVKISNEAVWAKEDLFREQNKELASVRRERDNSEADRAQHFKKIHDLQEHIREKEGQFLALEEQNKVAQETILYKDEQLREAQTWMSRVQEMDAFQSTTNQSLQAELRERTEQFNQYWIALQRQFVEMERHHLQTIQQLQLELSELRGMSGIYKDGSQATHANLTEASYIQSKESQVNGNDGARSSGSLTFTSDGKFSASNSSTKTEHAPGVPVVPSSILGTGAFLPAGQMAALHPFVMHPQAVPQSATPTNSVIPQSHIGHVQSISESPAQHWQNQQVMPEIFQGSNQGKYHQSQSGQNPVRSHPHHGYVLSAEGKVLHTEHLNSHINQQLRSAPVTFGSNEQMQVLESNSETYQVSQETQETLNANSHLNAVLFVPTEQKSEHKAQDQNTDINGPKEQLSNSSQQWSASNVAASAAPSHGAGINSTKECNESVLVYPEVLVPATGASVSMATVTVESTLLDERALLACIVRAIPAGSAGRIRISTTLPNRLGKMLAPLHWHDYKKHYGKLDDFVAHHPELFVIEGDFIHLREGAQEIISATAAVAKVAAAAAASSAPYSSLFPSVAVTPMPQSNRHKKGLSLDSNPVNSVSLSDGAAIIKTGSSSDKHSQITIAHNHPPNCSSFNIVQGLSDVTLSNKRKNSDLPNGLAAEMRPIQSIPIHIVGNGSNKEMVNGRLSFGGKPQGSASASGTGMLSRR